MRITMLGHCGIVALFALVRLAPLLLGVAGGSYVGVNFPQDVARKELDVSQLQNHGMSKVRIYNTDPAVLRTLAHTNIEVVVGMENKDIPEIANSQQVAHAWVVDNILPHVATTKITVIAMGNEVMTEAGGSGKCLLQAMRNIHGALVSLKSAQSIKVSTPHSALLLETSFPPSSGSFQKSHLVELRAILEFLSETNAPFMLNVYPFHLHEAFTQAVSFNYYLFKKNAGIDDSVSGLHYDNYMDAILDSVSSAMGELNYTDIPIVVSDTRWPSHDHLSQIYNLNLQNHILNHPGTPMRPTAEIGIYVNDFFYVPMHHLSLNKDLSTYSGRPQARKLATLEWCIAVSNASDTAYQGALDWVCGTLTGQGNVNCGPIQSGQSCYTPNTLQAHCSWAFNAYFQSHNATAQSCDFQGVGEITTTDPSTSTCTFTGSTSNATTNGTSSSNSTTSPSAPNTGAAHMFQPQPLLRISTFVALISYFLTGQAF